MNRVRVTCCVLLLLAVGLAAGADVVRLKSGGSLRGQVVKQDEKSITLRVPYGTVIIDRAQVVSVEKEDAGANAAAQAAALLRDGRVDEAVAALEEALAKDPDSAALRDRLVTALRRKAADLVAQGKPLDAEKCQRRILEVSPDDVEAAEEVRRLDEARRSAPEAEKEALLLVQFGREREALDLFAGLEAIAPGTPERNKKAVARARAEYGRRLLELKRLAEARRQLDLALKLDPTLRDEFRREIFVARFSVLVQEMNDKGGAFTRARWEAVLAELRSLEPFDKDNLHLHYAIGICLQELRRFPEAAEEYARVLGEKADPEKAAEQVAALQALASDKTREAPILLHFPSTRFQPVRPGTPQTIETVHFVIHHCNDELAALVARAAEYYLERNWRVFADRMPDKPWSKKCDIWLYRSKEEYLQHSRQAEWSTAQASTSAIGGVLERHSIMTYQTVEDLLSSDLPHEVTHIIHGAVVNYSASIPSWLREGTAVRQEPWFKRLRMARVLKEAKEKGAWMTLDQILDQKGYPDAGAVNLFYAQSYALVETLQRAGTREQFARFCRTAQTTPILSAVRDVYQLDGSELSRRWEEHENDLIALLDTP